jgi:hypothetical protein
MAADGTDTEGRKGLSYLRDMFYPAMTEALAEVAQRSPSDITARSAA